MISSERLCELTEWYEVPGAQLGVLVDGSIREVAVGVTNRDTDVAVTPATLFQIGSVSKVWTATLAVMLVETGALELDVPLRHYVPELKLPDEKAAEVVTMRHLLTHTSGLPGDFFPDTGRGDDCLERYLPLLAETEMAHDVGELYSYSNTAFALAGLAIERVHSSTWDVALRQLLIAPLGLRHTVTLPEDALLHRAAAGHLGTGPAQQVTPVWMLPRGCGPAGLITAAARDVLAFAQLHLQLGVSPEGQRLLSADSVLAMQQLHVTLPGQTSDGRGLGWAVSEWGGRRVLQHDGGTIGQAAALRLLPELNTAIHLSANGGNWTGFRDAVLAEVVPMVADVAPPAPPTPSDASAPGSVDIAGVYRNIGTELTVMAEDGRFLVRQRPLNALQALASAGEPTPSDLVPLGGDQFMAASPDGASWIPVTFLRDEHHQIKYLHASGRAARRVSR